MDRRNSSPSSSAIARAPRAGRTSCARCAGAASRRRSSPSPAAETLFRDWDDFVTFYDFPAEHWLHLRTSNPIESVFAGVRLRTDVAKRARVRENALYLVFQIVERLGRHW